MPNKKKAPASKVRSRAGSGTRKKDRTKVQVRDRTKVRYAVVGLGYFAQMAVLPAFAHAKNSKLTALISDDPDKMKKLARKYGIDKIYTYEQYQECLASKEVDAVYIALPNHLHKEYAIRAAKMGVHVLCEKPMAPEVRDCEEMIREGREHDVRLMIAYRLHFDPATLKAIEIVNGGRIGEPRHFSSTFALQVKPGNVRVTEPVEKGGGPLFDIGVYCINAARNLFRDEPEEAFAVSIRKDDKRFQEVEEMDSAILRFPGNRVATFTCSFGAADIATYRVLGTKGDLRVEPGYEYAMPIKHYLTVGGKTKVTEFRKKDQIAGEIVYFSDCVLKGTEPEPSGTEGLADVRVVRALIESARTGRPVKLGRFEKRKRPTLKQAKVLPPVDKPELVGATEPSKE